MTVTLVLMLDHASAKYVTMIICWPTHWTYISNLTKNGGVNNVLLKFIITFLAGSMPR
jgi:hypothetical protein